MKTDDLITALADDLAPTNPLPPPWRRSLTWFAMTIPFFLVVLAFDGLRPDFAAVSASTSFWWETAGTIALTLCTVLSAFYLSVPGTDLKSARNLAWLPLSVWFLGALGGTTLRDSGHFHLPDAICAIVLFATAILPFGAFWWMTKRAAPVFPIWVCAAAALGSACFGFILLQFTCPATHSFHVIPWHYAPVVVLGLVGLTSGVKLFKW